MSLKPSLWKQVKLGCIIAPTLFAVFSAAILKLFNLNRFRAKTKVCYTSIMELQYSDDNAIVAHSREELQENLNAFAEAYRALGLVLNIKKIQVLHQPPPNQPSTQYSIKVGATTLENVDHFPYLESILSSSANIDSELNHRLSCASGA